MTISQRTRDQAVAHVRRADLVGPASPAMLVIGMIALATSIWKREPGRHVIPAVLLTIAGLFQFWVV